LATARVYDTVSGNHLGPQVLYPLIQSVRSADIANGLLTTTAEAWRPNRTISRAITA